MSSPNGSDAGRENENPPSLTLRFLRLLASALCLATVAAVVTAVFGGETARAVGFVQKAAPAASNLTLFGNGSETR